MVGTKSIVLVFTVYYVVVCSVNSVTVHESRYDRYRACMFGGEEGGERGNCDGKSSLGPKYGDTLLIFCDGGSVPYCSYLLHKITQI